MIDNSVNFNSPNRSIKAQVKVYDFSGDELLYAFTADDALVNFTIDRTGAQNKFFGFGIVQTLTLELLDKEREITLEKENIIQISMNAGEGYYNPFPYFYINEIKRNENTNGLTITAFDAIGMFSTQTTVDAIMEYYNPISIRDYAQTAVQYLNLDGFIYPDDEYTEGILDREYPNGANYNGNETVRAVLDDIAEATQTIYFIAQGNNFTFKRLEPSADAVLSIGKDAYFTLELGEPVTLAQIVSVTELGDNVSASVGYGATQYVRSNGFWDIQDDIADLVDGAIDTIGTLVITPFNLDWRGNYYLELGDKVLIVGKDDGDNGTFILSDTLKYNGGLSQLTSWSYEETGETASNPSSLGEVITQTYAKVDKAAKQVEIVVSEVAANTQNISSLTLTTGGISADVAELDAAVNATMTSEDIKLEIKREIAENGVDKVITSTGFVFDDAGLTVSKSGTEMQTVISEDGMTVNKNGAEMLKADNTGVVAKNLHAITYLIVGENSRFENYGSDRTGCFWIGG